MSKANPETKIVNEATKALREAFKAFLSEFECLLREAYQEGKEAGEKKEFPKERLTQ